MAGKLEKADKTVGKLTKLWADLVSTHVRANAIKAEAGAYKNESSFFGLVKISI